MVALVEIGDTSCFFHLIFYQFPPTFNHLFEPTRHSILQSSCQEIFTLPNLVREEPEEHFFDFLRDWWFVHFLDRFEASFDVLDQDVIASDLHCWGYIVFIVRVIIIDTTVHTNISLLRMILKGWILVTTTPYLVVMLPLRIHEVSLIGILTLVMSRLSISVTLISPKF